MIRSPAGGQPPPRTARVENTQLDLEAVAAEICDRYHAEFTDENARYGDAGREWCRHDNQWLLHWAVNDILGLDDIGRQALWLAGVLRSRDFPIDRLVRNLQIAAEVATARVPAPVGTQLATRLTSAAVAVAAGPDGSAGE